VPRSKSVITINFNPPVTRWLLVLPALLAIFCAWFAVRWYVGDVIAEYAPTPEQGGVEMAQVAVRWAPDDPLTHWRLASFEEKTFTAENLAAAVQHYQLAVKASPYDYRYWMELGRALEAVGDRDASERALRRAVVLAPNYSHPLWSYGNVLLRQGKIEDAFVQLSKAADADEEMRAPVFGLATQVYGNDMDQVLKVLPQPAVRMQLAINLVNANNFAQASQVLRTISPEDRKAHGELADKIVSSLINNQQFQTALSLIRQLEPDQSQVAVAEQFFNGGFEQDVPMPDPKPFHWTINSRPQAQISIDPRGHNSGRSLRVTFSSPNKLDKVPISQTIVIEPNTVYRIQFYVRTDKLVSASTPMVSVTDATTGAQLAASEPVASGTNDWQLVTLNFKSTAKSEGISIGILRAGCEAQPICPIFGTVWYDDFNLQRVDSPGSSSGKTRAGN